MWQPSKIWHPLLIPSTNPLDLSTKTMCHENVSSVTDMGLQPKDCGSWSVSRAIDVTLMYVSYVCIHPIGLWNFLSGERHENDVFCTRSFYQNIGFRDECVVSDYRRCVRILMSNNHRCICQRRFRLMACRLSKDLIVGGQRWKLFQLAVVTVCAVDFPVHDTDTPKSGVWLLNLFILIAHWNPNLTNEDSNLPVDW
jgi:hypothetical protein